DDATDAGVGHVVTSRHGASVTLELASEAWPEGDGTGEGDHAADGVDDGGAGEVAERRGHRGEPGAPAPDPVADDRVDEARDADRVDQVADEAAAADHGTGGDGRARVGEGELEHPEGQEGDAGGAVRGREARVDTDEEVVRADPAVALAEHE